MENMKYKVGDKVRINSLDWYNANKDETDDIECSNNIWFYRGMSKFCGKVMTISHVRVDHYTMVEDLVGYWTDEMIEGLVEEDVIDIDEFQDDDEIIDIIDEYVHRLKDNECQIVLPEGYQFTDENGNVINAKKIVLEKKSPKTDDIIKWLREHDMTKYIGVIYSGMCSITFDTEKLIKDITEIIGDE